MGETTTLVIGRGEVYFDRFAPGTRVGEGELYIGNTSSFVVGRDIERLDRYTAYNGQKIKGPSAFVSETHTISFRTDNISPENVGLWYGGDNDPRIAPSNFGDGTPVVETLTVKTNRYYQLGLSVNKATGLRLVRNVSVSRGGVFIPALGTYEVDEDQGRICVLSAGSLFDGDTVRVSFEWLANVTQNQSPKPRDQFGALRFVGMAGYGPQRNYYYPMVRLSATGTVELKGDDWQALQFTADALKRDAFTEIVYVQEISEDTGGLTADSFRYFENILDDTVNVIIPSRGYV
jgi:hypothetical protein